MLERAKALFSKKGAAAPAAEPFAFRCTCGRKVEGLRRAEAQALNCESCGAAVFILPVNQLPTPGPAKKSKAARSRRSAPIAPAMEPVPDDVLDVSIPMPGDGTAPGPRRPAILDRKWLEDEPDEEEIARRARPWITRRQAIAVGVVAFILLGGYGLYRRLVGKELIDNLPDRARRGLQLVQEGKLEEAYEPLRLAWKAIDWAGGKHSQSDAIYQAFQEVAAVKNLLPEPFDDALEASLQDPSSLGARYKGKTVLLDLQVERNPEGGWLFHWAIPVGERVARLHPRGVKLLDDLDVAKLTRVLLAARIETAEKTSDGLQVLLQPESGVLVTELAMLERMGLGGDASADAVRQAQRRRVIAE